MDTRDGHDRRLGSRATAASTTRANPVHHGGHGKSLIANAWKRFARSGHAALAPVTFAQSSDILGRPAHAHSAALGFPLQQHSGESARPKSVELEVKGHDRRSAAWEDASHEPHPQGRVGHEVLEGHT